MGSHGVSGIEEILIGSILKNEYGCLMFLFSSKKKPQHYKD
jgi:hypothetical protein